MNMGLQGQSLQNLKNEADQKLPPRDSDSLINNISSSQKPQKRGPSPRKSNAPVHSQKDNGKIEQIIEKNKKLMDKYNVMSAKQGTPKGTRSVNSKARANKFG